MWVYVKWDFSSYILASLSHNVCVSCRRTKIIFDIFRVDFTSNIIIRVVPFFRKFRTFTETWVSSGQEKFTIHTQFGSIDYRCVDYRRGRGGVYFMNVFCPPREKTKCVYQRQQGQQGNLHSSQYTSTFDSLYIHSNASSTFWIMRCGFSVYNFAHLQN